MINRKKGSRKQKLYKMKGCYKKSRKNYLGGATLDRLDLAYPSSDVKSVLNPHLAKGGSSCKNGPGFPQGGPPAGGLNFINSQKMSGGGGCNCGLQGGGNMTNPNGLVGSSWGAPINKWPGVDGVDGGRNHYAMNKYIPDVSRQMKISGGGKRRKNKSLIKRRTIKNRNQKGGFIVNDMINLSKFGAGSVYNALRGYEQPVSPVPWRDQLTKFNPKTI